MGNPEFDLAELSKHGAPGEGLEMLVEELARRAGLDPQRSGRGSDNGRDLIVTERYAGSFCRAEVRWLVSCKDHASSGNSVPPSEIVGFVEECAAHRANGFLLVTTTTPSTNTRTRLEAKDVRHGGSLFTHVWDEGTLHSHLLRPENYDLFARFLPQSFHTYINGIGFVRLDNGLYLNPDNTTHQGFCTCRQGRCTGQAGTIYCYWHDGLPSWVQSKRLYWRCYDETIECPRCGHSHKRGHVGKAGVCNRPYDDQVSQGDWPVHSIYPTQWREVESGH